MVRTIDADDVVAEMLIEEGTPIEGTAAGPMLSGPERRSREEQDDWREREALESSFVAGEIDVPTPPSFVRRDALERRSREDEDDRRERDTLDRDHDTPAVEFTAASSILGQPEPLDADTGSRTPPIERR